MAAAPIGFKRAQGQGFECYICYQDDGSNFVAHEDEGSEDGGMIHHVHETCLRVWQQKSKNIECPTCRKPPHRSFLVPLSTDISESIKTGVFIGIALTAFGSTLGKILLVATRSSLFCSPRTPCFLQYTLVAGGAFTLLLTAGILVKTRWCPREHEHDL